LKKLVSLTVTHTEEREEVADYYSKDSSLPHFLSLLNKRYFCFHNVLNKEYCVKIGKKVKNTINDMSFLLYKTNSFNVMFESFLKSIKKEGFSDLVYLPDDAACVTKDLGYMKEVVSFYKRTKNLKFLSLSIKAAELKREGAAPQKVLHTSKNFILTHYAPSDFKDSKLLDIINRPFIVNIDYLLNLCDETYTSLLTKNEGDLYLRSQFLKTYIPYIAIPNKRLFRCFYYNSPKKETRQKELHLMRKLLQHKKHLV
jgi:hypothetical protein